MDLLKLLKDRSAGYDLERKLNQATPKSGSVLPAGGQGTDGLASALFRGTSFGRSEIVP